MNGAFRRAQFLIAVAVGTLTITACAPIQSAPNDTQGPGGSSEELRLVNDSDSNAPFTQSVSVFKRAANDADRLPDSLSSDLDGYPGPLAVRLVASEDSVSGFNLDWYLAVKGNTACLVMSMTVKEGIGGATACQDSNIALSKSMHLLSAGVNRAALLVPDGCTAESDHSKSVWAGNNVAVFDAKVMDLTLTCAGAPDLRISYTPERDLPQVTSEATK